METRKAISPEVCERLLALLNRLRTLDELRANLERQVNLHTEELNAILLALGVEGAQAVKVDAGSIIVQEATQDGSQQSNTGQPSRSPHDGVGEAERGERAHS